MCNYIGQYIKPGDIVRDKDLRINLDLNLEDPNDRKRLHGDLQNIRQWRQKHFRTPENKPIGIDVVWNGNSKVITAVVLGWPFEVIGYENPRGYVSFGGEKDLTYEGHKNGHPQLSMVKINEYLDTLYNYPPSTEYNHYLIQFREAFLMCIFLTSEMVRNEFLQLAFTFPKVQAMDGYGTWENYRPLYTSWQTTVQSINNYSLMRLECLECIKGQTISSEELDPIIQNVLSNIIQQHPEDFNEDKKRSFIEKNWQCIADAYSTGISKDTVTVIKNKTSEYIENASGTITKGFFGTMLDGVNKDQGNWKKIMRVVIDPNFEDNIMEIYFNIMIRIFG